MKKLIFTLLALVGTMSMNAQVMKVMKNGQDTPVETYSGSDYYVVFEEAPAAPATTGTEKRTGDIDVKWVQLWEGGPKFAEYNIGASSVTETGTKMTFTEATSAEYVWGANWCTPSKEQMDELLKAATSSGSEKVTCEYTQEGGTYGFKFTGKETGYTSNSVFFPAWGGYSDYGYADYWSAAANGSEAWYMRLRYNYGWDSHWLSYYQDFNFLVRPVLK